MSCTILCTLGTFTHLILKPGHEIGSMVSNLLKVRL